MFHTQINYRVGIKYQQKKVSAWLEKYHRPSRLPEITGSKIQKEGGERTGVPSVLQRRRGREAHLAAAETVLLHAAWTLLAGFSCSAGTGGWKSRTRCRFWEDTVGEKRLDVGAAPEAGRRGQDRRHFSGWGRGYGEGSAGCGGAQPTPPRRAAPGRTIRAGGRRPAEGRRSAGRRRKGDEEARQELEGRCAAVEDGRSGRAELGRRRARHGGWSSCRARRPELGSGKGAQVW